MQDKNIYKEIDVPLIVITLCLVLIGLITLYSGTLQNGPNVLTKQMVWALIGFTVMFIVVLPDYMYIERMGYVIYGGAILLLIAVLVFGRPIAGSQRWLELGPFTIQPSEFTKIAFIIVMARYFSDKSLEKSGLTFRELIKPTLLLLLPFLLIAKEPDLGTALVMALIFCSIMVVIKLSRVTTVVLAIAFAAFMPIAWGLLKDYQKARIMSFIDPSRDPFGSGYHVLQSKIAIGSGGLTGKGFLENTQGTLMFLPEHHTDFIFPIFAEEWGLIGTTILVFLFFSLIVSTLHTAKTSKDKFGFIVCLGVASMFFWHTLINIGMVMGLMPVVGVPLPFLSYGGSFLVSSLIAVGLVLNINLRRYK